MLAPVSRTFDDVYLDRVKRAYRLAIGNFPSPRGTVWREIFERQKPVHDALMDESNDRLAAVFSDPGSTNLFFGVDNLCLAVSAKPDSGELELQALRQIAEAVGRNADEPDKILSLLDGALAQRVEFPNPFRGEVGYLTARGLASYRAVQALYHTYRIRQLVPVSNARVLEIGPGMGRTALYAFRAGVRDYTTIDLPMGVVAQACFLGTVLGPDNIWMIGDDSPANSKIRLLPAHMPPQNQFDLVFNSDSLVEMAPLEIAGYLNFIRKRAVAFLSINHEKRRTKIKHFAGAILFGWQKRRTAYALRSGYFEEIFEHGK
jgi:hypothetical protein